MLAAIFDLEFGACWLPLQQEDQQFPMPQVEYLKALVARRDSIE